MKKKLNFKIIACVNQKMCLGKDNTLLYYLPSDLKHFKSLTTDNVVIMGKKTYDSLPIKPLPNRINIVLTSDSELTVENGHVVRSISECIELCNKLYNNRTLYIIGGASIYNQFISLGLVESICLSYVKDDMEGDVYFPDVLNDSNWTVIDETLPKQSEKDSHKYTIILLERKKT